MIADQPPLYLGPERRKMPRETAPEESGHRAIIRSIRLQITMVRRLLHERHIERARGDDTPLNGAGDGGSQAS